MPSLPNIAAFEAPADSHLFAWKYFDLRLYPDLPNPLGAQVSLLYVWFRNKDGSMGTQWVYGFVNPDEGQAISDALQASAHPYGEVLHPRVIKANLPNRRA